MISMHALPRQPPSVPLPWLRCHGLFCVLPEPEHMPALDVLT